MIKQLYHFSMNGSKGTNIIHNEFPLVSIVIPHFNGEEILLDCLKSLKKSNYPNLEIIVVDNGSSDNSIKVVREKFSNIKIITSEKNRGYAGGCNLGAQNALGNFLFFLNNDTIQEPSCISDLIKIFIENPTVSVVQPKILNFFEKDSFDYAGGCGGHLDIFCFPFVKGRLFNSIEKDNGQYDYDDEIFWASGTAMMIIKKDFIDCGGFDEFFFAHQEEIDLQWRLHLRNKKIKINPHAIVYHKNAMTLSSDSVKKKYLNHRNSLLMMLTNYSLSNLFFIFPVRLLLEFIALFYSLFLFDLKHFIAILRSLIWFILNPIAIYKRRQKFSKDFIRNDANIISHMYRRSIVFDFFILQKKNYLNLDIAS